MSYNSNNPRVVYEVEPAQLEAAIEAVFNRKIEELAATLTPSSTHASDGEELITSSEARNLLRRSRATLWRYEQMGILKPVRRGKSLYYRRKDIESIFDKMP